MNFSRNSPSVLAASAVGLGLCVLFGLTPFVTWLTARLGWLLVPSAAGLPFGLPGLRAVPLGEQGWPALVVSVVAAGLLVVVAGAWTARACARRPAAGRVRVGLSAWAGLLLGAVVANAFRVVAVGTVMGFGPVGYAGYAAGGALSGAGWGVALGWTAGVAAALAWRGAERGAPARA